MQATACKDDAYFLLMAKPNLRVCQETDGPTLKFRNPVLLMRLERVTTHETKLAFRRALRQAVKPLGLMLLMLCLTSFMQTTTCNGDAYFMLMGKPNLQVCQETDGPT